MKRRRITPTGKAFRAGQAAKFDTENEAKHNSSNIAARQVDTSSALVGEYVFRNCRLRTITRDREAWFTANNVCAVLDIANTRDALGWLAQDGHRSRGQ